MKEFKKYLSEMTMSYGQDNYLGPQDFSGAKHVGDIQNSKILYKQINGLDFYGITEDDNPNKSANFDPNKVISWIQVQNQNILGKDYFQHFLKKIIYF